MFECFWARQARVRVGLVENAYKIDNILTILQKHCSRTGRPYRYCQNAYNTHEIWMVLTRPWRIGEGVVWRVVILRLKIKNCICIIKNYIIKY